MIVNEESGLLSRQMGSTVPYFSKELAEQGKMNCYWPNADNTEYLALAVEKRRIFWMGNMDYTPCNNRFPEKCMLTTKCVRHASAMAQEENDAHALIVEVMN